MEWICALFMIVGAAAIIAVFVRAFRRPDPAQVLPRTACPFCGYVAASVTCPACMKPKGSPTAQRLEELRAASRLLERYALQGRIDQPTFRNLVGMIDHEISELRQGRAPAPPTSPQPIRPATAPVTPAPVPDDEFIELELIEAGQAASPTHPALPPPAPAPRREPREPLANLISAFLEESHIRWGELAAGMLIVLSAAALVVSFWSSIAQIPVLKFFLFTAVTAAIYGLGFYSEHRWRLPMTSRGSLIIATLLVPLNFLAIAAFSQGYGPWDPWVLGGEAIAVGLFGFMIARAGRVLVPGWSGALLLGVLGPSVAQLVIRRAMEPGAEAPWATRVGLALLPLACYLAANGWALARAWAWRTISPSRAHRMFAVIGLTSFAALAALGLLLQRCWNAPDSLRSLTSVLALHSLPALALGLLFLRKQVGRRLGVLQTIGIAIGVGGAALMAVSTLIALPEPAWMLPVLAIDAVLLAAIAVRFAVPAAHVPALLGAGLIYFILVHVGLGHLPWRGVTESRVIASLVAWQNGIGFTALAAALGGIAAAWFATRRKSEGMIYAAVAALVGAAGLTYVTAHCFGRADDHGATWIYLAEAALAFVAAWRLRRAEATWVGCGLLLAALVQGVAYRFHAELPLAHPWQAVMLIYATLTLGAAFALRRRDETGPVWFPFSIASLATTAAAVVLVTTTFVMTGRDPGAGSALQMLWAAALLLGLAVRFDAHELFISVQVMVTAAVVMAVGAWLSRYAWFLDDQAAWLHPWTVQAVGAALAMLGLAWVGMRLALRRVGDTPAALARLRRLALQPEPRFDRFVTAALMLAAGALAWIACLPAIAVEFAPTAVESEQVASGLTQFHAGGWGSWALLGTTALVLVASLWEGFAKRRVIGLVMLGFVACVLLAARFEGIGAGASMLRWSTAAYLLAASTALWWRHRLEPLARRARWPHFDERERGLGGGVALLVSIVAAALIICLTAYPVLAAPVLGPRSGTFFHAIGRRASYLIPLGVLAFTLAGHAVRDRKPGYALAAALVTHLSVTLAHLTVIARAGGFRAEHLIDLLASNAATAGFIAALWVGVRSWLSRLREAPAVAAAKFHHAFVWLSLALLATLVAAGLMADAVGQPLATSASLAAIAAAGAAAALWMVRHDGIGSRYAPFAAYVLGMFVVGRLVDRFDLAALWLAVSGAMILPVYSLAAAVIWRTVRPREDDPAAPGWLVSATGAATLVGVVLSFIAVMVIDAGNARTAGLALLTRLGAATLAIGHAGALGVLANRASVGLRRAALVVASIVAVLLAWAWITPGAAGDSLLHREVAALVALASCAAAFGVAAKKLREVSWIEALRGVVPGVAAVALAALGVVLMTEVIDWMGDGSIAIAPWAIGVVALSIVVSAAASLAFAILPGADPLSLRPRGRTAYVYGAEVLLALLFMHVRMTMPWLFSGFFAQYWPLVVMAIAFLGLGLSELFRRSGHRVLEEPLRVTGALLPVLPVVTFYNLSDQHRVHFSVITLLAGVVYGLLAATRKSFAMALLAALSLSGALWYQLAHTPNLGFFEHPQLWLIPAAAAVLVATQLNRARLDPQQLAMMRYLCVTVIYVSSTAEIFLHGVRESPWLPLVLMGLSVAGIALGAAVRVRSFLFLGSTFLFISLITMIWHASASLGWTWLWYVAGIALGAAIIVLLALAEKKRQTMLRLVDGLKAWEG